jgi:hypothetical protein
VGGVVGWWGSRKATGRGTWSRLTQAQHLEAAGRKKVVMSEVLFGRDQRHRRQVGECLRLPSRVAGRKLKGREASDVGLGTWDRIPGTAGTRWNQPDTTKTFPRARTLHSDFTISRFMRIR